MNMDKELEYRALLEQVTREAEREAELDMQSRTQPSETEEFVGNRNGPGNILNRLDVHARLGSRVALLEEPVHLLHSRLGGISANVQQPIATRSSLNQQAFPHTVEHMDYQTARYSTQTPPVLDRLGSPQPLLGDPRMHAPLRNHPPLAQHGSFAENDLHQQDSFYSPPSFSSPVEHFTEAQQRPPTEYPEKRRSPRIAQERLSRRPLLRSPITTHRTPPAHAQSPKVTGNSNGVKPSNTGAFSQPANSKKGNLGSSWAKSTTLDGEKPFSLGTKSPIVADKKGSDVVVESSPGQSLAVAEKNVPSLFGPPPSKITTQRSKKAVTSDVGNVLEPPTKPKPLMEITPVNPGLPFSTSLLNEASSQPEKKVMHTKSDFVHSKVVTSIASKPVSLLDIKPVPLLDIKLDSKLGVRPASAAAMAKPILTKPVLGKPGSTLPAKPASTTIVKSSSSATVKPTSTVKLTSIATTSVKPVPSLNKELTLFGNKSNQKVAKPTVETNVVAKSGADSTLSSTSKNEAKTNTSQELTLPTQTSSVGDFDVGSTRPLWYANPDCICEQSDGELSGTAEDARHQTCESAELEEGEIAGESLSEEMDVQDKTISTNPSAAPTTTTTTSPPVISSEKILEEYLAESEMFAHFLPFRAEASEDNVNTVEKCWHQVLVLPSLQWKQKKPYWTKIQHRLKSHFGQRSSKPSFNYPQYCSKLWTVITNHLGTYLQRRLGDFVRGIIHRSMIDFTLIRMKRKNMPRSLNKLPMKSQINLLYIFNTQGFINAINNYIVKWLQDEVDKVDARHATAANLTAQVSELSSKVNDELLEKKFCFAEYLNSKSFNNAEEDENCSRICSLLKCKDYMPGAVWKYGIAAVDTEVSSSNQMAVEVNEATSAVKSVIPIEVKSPPQEVDKHSEMLYKSNKVIVPKNVKLQDVQIKLQVLGDKVSAGEAKKKSMPHAAEITAKSSNETKPQPMSSNSKGLTQNTNVRSKPVVADKPEQLPCLSDPKVAVPPQSSNVSVHDDSQPTDSVNIQVEPSATNAELKIKPKIVVKPQDEDSNEKQKAEDTTKAEIIVAEKPIVPVPEITVTPTESERKVSTSTSANENDDQHQTNDKKLEEKQGITRKLQVNSAGKWRSYTSDSNSCSRPVSRKRRASRGKRAHNRPTDSRKLTGGDHSEDDKSAGSGSDSEDLEMMMLRKKALLSMLKASQTRKTKTNTESDKMEVQESESKKLEAQPYSLAPPADMLAIEQISDTESPASPVAHCITESNVVLVSLGPDNVLTFPSQYNSTTPQSSNVQNDDTSGVPDLAAVKQVKGTDDMKQDNVKQDDNHAATPPAANLTEEVVGSSSAYYKVSTGGADQKQKKKETQSFVICVSSEDSDSDWYAEHTASNSAVTSGTSSPMPNSSAAGLTKKDIAKLTDLEEMIQHYKKKAKEKEVKPSKTEQSLLKSPDAIKKMPQLKQDEYRSLKEQMIQLEKKKNERKVHKRKAPATTVSEAKRTKVDSEEQDDVVQKLEAQNAKKVAEYRTNIAVCETQLTELRSTIDHGHSDVKSLNKQLSECDSEIEEHTMKLQLLNKQLQIAKDLLDASKTKQQDLKDKVKVAKNSLLKDKNVLAVVEGELAQYQNLLATMLQDQPHKVSVPSAMKPEVLDDDGEIVKQSLETVNESTIMEVTNSAEVDSTVAIQALPAEGKAVQDISTDTQTSTPVYRPRAKLVGAKTQPGQRISHVIQRLVQEQQSNATNPIASEVEEKTKRKSLDAVVAQLHVVKNQELDKMFCVDLGSTKIVRENSKLDSVVEKLTAKQNQPQQLFPTSYLVGREDLVKTSEASVSSVQHTEADTSVDNSNIADVHLTTEDDKMEFDQANGSEGKLATNADDCNGKLYKQNSHDEKSGVGNNQAVNVGAKQERDSLPMVTTGNDEMYDLHTSTNQKATTNLGNPQKLASPGTSRKVTVKVIAVSNQEPTPTMSIVSSSSKPIVSSSGKSVLAKVTNNLTQKYQMKSVDLELLLEHNESSDDLVHVTCDGLTEYCAARVYNPHHQNIIVSDVVLTELLQPDQGSSSAVSGMSTTGIVYKSPLTCFKSYRLHPYYRTRAKLSVSSPTYSNKINPSNVMCKFDMIGFCGDKKCKWQHWSDTKMDLNEVFADVISYAPNIASVKDSDDISTAIKKLDTYVNVTINSFKEKMSPSQIGVYLVDQVARNTDSRIFNMNLARKVHLPVASDVSGMRRPRSFASDYLVAFDSVAFPLGSIHVPDKVGADVGRYFTALQVTEADSNCDPDKIVSAVRKMMLLKQDDATSKRAVSKLEAALNINPHAEVLWFELMKILSCKLRHPPFDLSGLNMLQDVCQRAFTTTNSYTILHQCILVSPTRNLKLKWYVNGYRKIKMNENKEIKSHQCLELFLGSVVLDHMSGFVKEAIEKMKFTLQLSDCKEFFPYKDLLKHLVLDDLVLMWIIYIHYCYTHMFPSCLIEVSNNSCRLLEKKPFLIEWKSGERLLSLYDNFIQLFKIALKSCKLQYSAQNPNHSSSDYASKFQKLFENLILLEFQCGNLEAAKLSIRKLLPVHSSYLGLWLLLADVVVQSGYKEGYKEVYVEAETALKGNAEFYYIVTKLLAQQGHTSEAIQWLTSCIYCKYSAKPLGTNSYDVVLHYRKLLGQPVPYQFQSSSVVEESDSQMIVYLWLCYCLYIEIVEAPQESDISKEYWPTVEEAYEAAVHSIHSSSSLKHVWKQYLLYLKSCATSQSAEHSSWKLFLDGVNRALQVIDPKDHSFQMEVMDICLTTMPAAYKDKTLGLYNHWCKIFPDNKTLVCRCADVAVRMEQIEMAQNVLATYLSSHPNDWNIWKKAIDIEFNLNNFKEVRWMFWEATTYSSLNIHCWKEFFKFELQQCVINQDTNQVNAVLQQCHHLGIDLTKLVSKNQASFP